MKRIGIIGGGIIGLFSAYYLLKKGHHITIFEQKAIGTGASAGNAGMIVPSHVVPLAAPGMIAKGIRWMFDAKSPFYVKPSIDTDLLRWGYLFYRSSSPRFLDKRIAALRDINLLSRVLYQELHESKSFDFGFQGRGILMLYQSAKSEADEREAAAIANRVGVEARLLSIAEAQDLEPGIRMRANGAVYYPNDAHIDPELLLRKLSEWLTSNGVKIQQLDAVTGIVQKNGWIQKIGTYAGSYDFDEVILAAGSWSSQVGRLLNVKLPMQAGKGYSFLLKNPAQKHSIPAILVDGKIAVTPIGDGIRFAGTLEIGGINQHVNMNRVKGIVETIPKFYPDFEVHMPSNDQIWSGLRPCSPDGLPYIGRSGRFRNLTVATGHAMMGISLAPATGKIISQIIDGEPTQIDISQFQVERFQ
jgi:D-amino-acid dehydrogenase